MSYSLLDCCRLVPQNIRSNEDFGVMLKLKRKLRLELWPSETQPLCFCGKRMDKFGDHCLSCQRHCKTAVHNKIRDGLWNLFKELMQTVRLVSSPLDVEREPERIVECLPRMRPFDFCVTCDPLLDESSWRTPLHKIGFDVTVVSSKPCVSTDCTSARRKELQLRLREGERMKFQRKGKSDKGTQVTLSGEEIIAYIIRNDMALIPIAVSPHGHLGSLFERFLFGTDALPITNFTEGRVHAEAASRVARSPKVPRAVLQRANDIWKTENPDTFYGSSYKAMDPMRYFQQQLGLVISTAISSHLLRAHNKNKSKRPLECKCADICETTVHTNSGSSEGVSNGCGVSCSRTASTAGRSTST